ncbi:hypothetical protein Bpfe_018388 [Biomphalaria pfeifferi]|uniref:Uncharacterized protein n=1 Tax=Biomphalaria pfeifferi TaxID=112525 RepID=A0AAD8BF48_BIOPF|nr:hypothetical protein Bpfe_018388 [Biomphalaria pfeifferi]
MSKVTRMTHLDRQHRVGSIGQGQAGRRGVDPDGRREPIQSGEEGDMEGRDLWVVGCFHVEMTVSPRADCVTSFINYKATPTPDSEQVLRECGGRP